MNNDKNDLLWYNRKTIEGFVMARSYGDIQKV